MKKNITYIIILVGTLGLLWSCSKNLEKVAPTSSPDGFAYIKIAQYSPNFRQVVNGRDSFNVYVNGVKLNGAFLTYGSIFPATTNLYAAVPPGSPQSIRITVNGVTTPDSVTLVTFTKTLVAGSYYSFLITDSLLTANESKQIFMEDKFSITDTSHFTIRFAHTILNDTLGKNVDVYSKRLAANMFSNISPGTVTTFITQPYNLVSDTLIVRRAGTTFDLATLLPANSIAFARQRAFTLLYKGIPNVTTGTKGRSLVAFYNQ